MFTRRSGVLICLLLTIAILSACAGGAPVTPAVEPGPTDSPVTPTVDESPVETEAPQETGGVWSPLDAAACDAVRAAVADALDAADDAVTVAEAPFQDIMTGEGGTGCQIRVTGTGADFDNFVRVAGDVKTVLQSLGWSEDPSYLADGPTGTAFGMRQGDWLGLVSVGWEPVAAGLCPQDQPISDCELQPEQQIYTIELNLAQSSQ